MAFHRQFYAVGPGGTRGCRTVGAQLNSPCRTTSNGRPDAQVQGVSPTLSGSERVDGDLAEPSRRRLAPPSEPANGDIATRWPGGRLSSVNPTITHGPRVRAWLTPAKDAG